MEAWLEQSFTPVAKTDDGNDIYGYVCLALTNDKEKDDFLHFLENHGIEVDWDE